MRVVLIFLISLVISSMLKAPLFCQLPDKDLVSGQIEMQFEEKKENRYEVVQDLAIEYFKDLHSLAGGFVQGTSGQLASISDEDRVEIFDYLTAVYLYCVIRNGKCPLVLDAVLESDLIGAKLTSGSDCLNMDSFWSRWRENDFERRQNYNLSTGRMVIAADFAKQHLPRYTNCRTTVADELRNSGAAVDFFKARYGGKSEKMRNLAKMVRFLELLKEQVGDVFIAVGAKE